MLRNCWGRSLALVTLLAALAAALLAGACTRGSGAAGDNSGKVKVAVTTEILADLVRNIGGERVEASSIVPPGGDPHSYEPTPADALKVAKADVAFTNHLLLEEHALIKLFDSNVREGVPNISLAETAEQYGAHLMALVEDVTLDTIWLGLAVRSHASDGIARSADVRLTATAFEGPGNLFVYVTSALGEPEIYFNTADGINADDVAVLPPGAHTHVNWAFTAPGVYHLTLSATLDDGRGTTRQFDEGTFTFAVGVDPRSVDLGQPATILDAGHADLSVDTATGAVFACTAPLSCAEQEGDHPAESVVIEVPNRALSIVPDDSRFSFLGEPDAEIWELPQAVLGKHVHGVIDPHLWEDVKNAQAYVRVMTDTLISVDPDGRDVYETNRDAYIEELVELDRYVAAQTAKIPDANRNLITTHDAFGYLAYAYGLRVAGFVVPNPAQEPSAVQVRRLVETIENLDVPAVFLEPNLHARASVLRQVAEDHGVMTCKIYGDAFDKDAPSYVAMMRHNADELLRCLGGEAP